MFIFYFSSCRPHAPENVSQLVISIPKEGVAFKGGVAAQSILPSNRKACYGMNITGGDLKVTKEGTCSLATGLTAGFVGAGEELSAVVPRGENRKIELFMYLLPIGESTCPAYLANPTALQASSTYLIGSADKIDMTGDEVTVEIQYSFPGLKEHVAKQLSLPSVCSIQNERKVFQSFSISTAKSKAQDASGNMIMHGRIGRIVKSNILSNSNYKLYMKD